MRRIVLWLCATPVVFSAIWIVINGISFFTPAMLLAGVEDPFALACVIVVPAIPFLVCAFLASRGFLTDEDTYFMTRACAWQLCLGFYGGVWIGFIIIWLGGALIIAYQNLHSPCKPLP